jgi:endonuclease-8
MEHGAVHGRIVTTRPADRDKPAGPVRRADRCYVYHRDGLPCRHCGTLVVVGVIGNRKVYWCPEDQPMQPVSQEPVREIGVR